MKRLFTLCAIVIAVAVSSCSKFDDSAIWDKLNEHEQTLNDHEKRIAALEELCKQMNTNISSLQTIVDALQNNDYVTNISPITEDGKVIGYTITFSKSVTITIYHGKDGKDGYAPVIGIAKDNDGRYYWTLDGDWLLDSEGNKVKADGKNGNDGITPKLKIENGYWFVSFDNGVNWIELGKAIGEDGDSMLEDVTYDDDYVYITLADGTELIVPRYNNEADIPNNQIWYTAVTAKVKPFSEDVFGATIVSNKWDGILGKGVITFDGEVTIIGNEAFSSCKNLTSITIPNTVTSIGDEAFSWCENLTSITIPNSVTSIGDNAFSGCDNLTSITIPNSVAWIGSSAFSSCENLTSITIPNCVAWNGSIAFSSCESLTGFYGKFASEDNRYLIIDGVLNSFAPAGLTEYAIPNSVTSIGDGAFCYCNNLTSITIPNSVTSIKRSAFEGCSSLTSIAIPDSVTEIGSIAFASCRSLESVYCKAITPPSLGKDAFKDLSHLTVGLGGGSYVNLGCAIYVPTESVNAYKAATNWTDYAVDIVGYDF